ncbi:hypothetical protein TTRE_0000950401 [Trichuris trichiura]|uniref:Reverse transcriptase domain-containing protein n=1 Tax=Trichuris trichiura TaxID=36087 RepID=A0A077ZQN1_TRITR|nr:hypothetical protein TTRE_0000950401 [Trichuris trichiura]
MDVDQVGARLAELETHARETGAGRKIRRQLPSMTEALPIVWMRVDGVSRRTLVDSGCTRCVIYAPCCRRWKKQPVSVKSISGGELQCVGIGHARLETADASEVVVDVLVCDQKPLGFDLILGMQGIRLLGGLLLDRDGHVRFNPPAAEICAAAEAGLRVEEKDFIVTYEPATRSWTTAWKWAGGNAPEVLHNRIEEYPPASSVKASYEEELETWVRNGWLIPYDERDLGPAKGLIPLMAVVQRSKEKVRPVLDFRELNTYIDTFTAKSDVCAEKLREWRQRGAHVAMLDLKKAYLQVRVEKSLWPYQTVMFRGRRYCLTRLGFGLNVAPTIMKAIVGLVLSLASDVSKGTSAYLDDILVDESIVSAHAVRKHLARYGLECKSPEKVSEGARVLGLAV